MGTIKGNKWVNGLIPALFTYISLGVIYCWSMIKSDIAFAMSCSGNEIEIAFSLSLLCLGLTAMVSGKLVDYNEKLSMLVSTILYGVGMGGSIYAISNDIPSMFVIMYGVVQGIALGIGYLSPIKTLMLWFDKHKGLSLGIVLTAFAGSKIVFAPLISDLLEVWDVTYVMGLLASIGLLFMSISTVLLRAPRDIVYEPVRWIDIKKNVLNKEYIAIWGMFLFNVACGVAMISYEKSFLLEVGFVKVTLAIAIVAMCNVMGRLIMPIFAQHTTNKANAYMYMFFFCILAVVIALIHLNPVTLIAMMCVMNFCYGAGFSCMPILLQDRFGYKNISLLHGLILSAWAIGGFFGDMFANFLFELLGTSGHVELIRKFFIFYMVAFIILFSSFSSKTK
jgi:OFA family oxalate/formate antiporter-like MFS transporter